MDTLNNYSPMKIAISAIQITLMSFGTYFLIKEAIGYIKGPKSLPKHNDFDDNDNDNYDYQIEDDAPMLDDLDD
jgi:hypothetical protein